MASFIDYLTWRGDIPLCEDVPLNEVDAALLARFSYFPFRKVYYASKESLGSLCRVMKTYPESEFQFKEDREIVEALVDSERFSSLPVTDIERHHDEKMEIQFSAVTIHLPNNALFLSFSGTDGTLLGWKENFNMSFQDNIPSQCTALSYAARAIKDHPDLEAIYLGGHSKGGNLATYAAVCIPEKYRHLIKGVYNFDGPGFSTTFIAEHSYEEMDPIIHTIMPSGSMFGRMLEHSETCDIIESSLNNAWQHDMYTWLVEGPRFVRAEKTTDGSELIYNSVRHLAEETTPKQREMVVTLVYSIAAANASTPAEIQKDFRLVIQPFLKEVWGMSKEDWRVISKVLRAAFDSGYLALLDYGYSIEPIRELLEAENFQDGFKKFMRLAFTGKTGGKNS